MSGEERERPWLRRRRWVGASGKVEIDAQLISSREALAEAMVGRHSVMQLVDIVAHQLNPYYFDTFLVMEERCGRLAAILGYLWHRDLCVVRIDGDVVGNLVPGERILILHDLQMDEKSLGMMRNIVKESDARLIDTLCLVHPLEEE